MWNFPRLPPYGTALVMEKLLPVSSLAMSLAAIMTYGWVLSLHEELSHPQPSTENHNPWNKINQHAVIATVAFAIVKGVFKICFQVHFPTSHLQSFVSQASATNHSPPPRDADGLFYTEPSSPCVWESLSHTQCQQCSTWLEKPEMSFNMTLVWQKLFFCAWTIQLRFFMLSR